MFYWFYCQLFDYLLLISLLINHHWLAYWIKYQSISTHLITKWNTNESIQLLITDLFPLIWFPNQMMTNQLLFQLPNQILINWLPIQLLNQLLMNQLLIWLPITCWHESEECEDFQDLLPRISVLAQLNLHPMRTQQWAGRVSPPCIMS